jgi:hypothetical protein
MTWLPLRTCPGLAAEVYFSSPEGAYFTIPSLNLTLAICRVYVLNYQGSLKFNFKGEFNEKQTHGSIVALSNGVALPCSGLRYG